MKPYWRGNPTFLESGLPRDYVYLPAAIHLFRNTFNARRKYPMIAGVIQDDD